MKRWPTKPLGDVAQVTAGVPAPQRPEDFAEDGVPFVRMQDVGRLGQSTCLAETKDRLSLSASARLKRFPAGSILVPKSGASIRLNHRAILGIEAHVVSHLAVIVPFPLLNTHFAYYWLCGTDLSGLAHQADLPSMKTSDLAKLQLPVPPLVEQERIVKLLDEADELRKLRAQADRRTADFIPALFHEMSGRADFVEKTIGQFLEQGWLLLHKDGNHGSLYPRSSDFGIEGIPFLSATCVTDEGTIDHSEVKRLAEEKAKLLRHGWIQCGDVLLAHNASVGAVGFYGGDYDRAIIGTSLTAFRANPDRIEPRFLWASLRDVFFQDQLERIMKQALRNQVPITAQRELFLRIPALALQKEFAARVSEIRALQSEQSASRCRLDELFKSMLQRAFNGEF